VEPPDRSAIVASRRRTPRLKLVVKENERGRFGCGGSPDAPEGTRFVFVLGTGRCGSTQLAHVVASHPQVGFVSNVEERLARIASPGRWNDGLLRSANRWVAWAGGVRSAPRPARWAAAAITRASTLAGPSEAYGLLAEEVSPMIVAPFRDLTAEDAAPWIDNRFRRFFANRASVQAKPVFMHKFTGWPRARFIDAVFPEARFVHLVRDGRAVASSLMQVPFWQGYRGPAEWSFGPLPESYAREWEESGHSFAMLAGLEWKVLMDAFGEAERAIPADRWLNVRYEDFTANPRAEVERILGFWGLPWTTDVERRLRGARITTARQAAFMTELGSNEIKRLTRALAGHLDRWGYTDVC
jgi:hypothetical protein